MLNIPDNLESIQLTRDLFTCTMETQTTDGTRHYYERSLRAINEGTAQEKNIIIRTPIWTKALKAAERFHNLRYMYMLQKVVANSGIRSKRGSCVVCWPWRYYCCCRRRVLTPGGGAGLAKTFPRGSIDQCRTESTSANYYTPSDVTGLGRPHPTSPPSPPFLTPRGAMEHFDDKLALDHASLVWRNLDHCAAPRCAEEYRVFFHLILYRCLWQERQLSQMNEWNVRRCSRSLLQIFRFEKYDWEQYILLNVSVNQNVYSAPIVEGRIWGSGIWVTRRDRQKRKGEI